jgi:hypothetical protein
VPGRAWRSHPSVSFSAFNELTARRRLAEAGLIGLFAHEISAVILKKCSVNGSQHNVSNICTIIAITKEKA